MTALSVRGLRKSYGPVRVLDGVDLDLAAGTTTAILGPSGCGKTTLLRLIAGFDRPDAGSIELAGTTVTNGRRATPPNKRDIGYVAQEGALFPHLTVRANVAFGLSRLSTRGAARGQRIDELLDLVSLDPALGGRYPHELSGGQQQRVALARALARRPALVLLDEPFSSLDTSLRAATRTAVAAALRTEGVTTLLVTHDRAEALSLADQVAVMVGGGFTQVDTAREVYARPVDLVSAQLLGPGVVLPGKVSAGTAWCALGRLPVAGELRDGDAAIFVRPEQLRITQRPADGAASAVVRASDYLGADTVVTVETEDGSQVDARTDGVAEFGVGDRVDVTVLGPVLAYAATEQPCRHAPCP